VSRLQHLPNVISALRLGTVPVLAWLAWNGADRSFAWLLLIAGSTDMLDGWMARKYGWVSRLGALLDSAADISMVLVVLFGVWTMRSEVFIEHSLIIWAVVVIWSITNIFGLIKYKRLASFHTEFARIGLMMFGAFILMLFFYGFVPWVLYACGTISFLAGVESLILVIMVDTWRPNLRGGLPALLAERRNRDSVGD
jgi:phosphatidylglycerophosphate synthase